MQPSYRDAGAVCVTSKPVVVPQVNVAAEQYNGIVRLVMRGIPVQREVNIAVGFSDETNQSVILCQVFAQAVNPEAGIAGLDFQEQLRCSQLVVKIKGCRSVCTANKLKISIDLSAFFLQRLELGLLYGDAFHQMLSKDFHAAYNIAFLHFFPFVVGLRGMIQMLVDSPAGEIVVDRDCAIRLSALGNRIDLLMDANGEGYIPTILAA
jgi:hypothetical protein